MRQLEVWWQGDRVGTLSQVDGRLQFTYVSEWLARPGAPPLSQSLPMRPESFDDRATRPFFAGLLPEGPNRARVAQVLHVSRHNDFSLLDGVGGECAGAVSLLEPGAVHASADETSVRRLDDVALTQLLDELPRRPLLAGQEGIRLSLAGAQDKLPVVVQDGRIGVPMGATPSTHILKPQIDGVDGSVFNEGFCMTLAAALRLPTAKVTIQRVADRVFLLVERYDRSVDADGRLRRLHQEDFCQALGVVPECKYQAEGGPDLRQCFALVRRVTRPSAISVMRLLDAVIFNALVGNHDAHGKNFSLLYRSAGGPALAPLYDVLSTAVYPQLTDKMAMKIGSRYRFSEVQARHWDGLAEACGLSAPQVRRRVLDLAQALPARAQTLRTTFDHDGNGHPVLDQIVSLIRDRCTRTVALLRPPPAVPSSQ